jgi:hypothetical protein
VKGIWSCGMSALSRGLTAMSTGRSVSASICGGLVPV